MKKFFIASMLSVGFVASVFATEKVETHETTEVKAEAVIATTASLDATSLVGQCAACHGKDGNSAAPNYPKLAGQNASYLLKQLKDIKSGKRSIAVMTGQLDGFNDAQLAAIAEHYSQQEITLNQAQDKYLALGEKIYRTGNASKGLPACTGCHSPSGKGNAGAGFPALGGQHGAYIAASLKSFREGAEYKNKGRKNDEMQGVMRDIAIKMSDKEIEAVSNYISGLYAK